MYSFEIDIGDWGTPVAGSGYIECNPLFSKCAIRRSNEDSFLRVRDYVDGELMFLGSEYTALKTLFDSDIIVLGIKIYKDAFPAPELIFTGELNLYGTWQTDQKSCSLKVETVDAYNKILAGLDLERYGTETGGIEHDYDTWVDLQCSAFDDGTAPGWTFETPENYGIGSTDFNDVPLYDAGVTYRLATANAYGRHDGVLADCFCRTVEGEFGETVKIWTPVNDFTFDVDPLTYPLQWQLLDIDIGVEIYAQERSSFRWDHGDDWTMEDGLSLWDEDGKYWYLETTSLTGSSYTKIFNRLVKIYDFIHDTLAIIDPTINIAETGEHGYFSYFEDTYINKFYLYVKYGDPETLSSIFGIFKFLGCDWYLDSSNYFRFVHRSEIAKTVPLKATYPQYHLNDYLSKNWTTFDLKCAVDKVKAETWDMEAPDEQYAIIDGNNTEINQDFRQQKIDYNNHFETVRNNKLSYNIDVREWDIAGMGSGGKFLMAAGSDNYLFNQLGVINTSTVLLNGGLACSVIVFNHLLHYNRPFGAGTYLTVLHSDIERVKKIENQVQVPIFDQRLYDFNNLVRTDLMDGELKSVSVKLDGSGAEITLLT